MRHAWLLVGLSLMIGCGNSGGPGGGPGGASSSSGGKGGAGGAGSCADALCGPGAACLNGACTLDCTLPGGNPCGPGTVCDVSEANAGKCVDPSSPCVTTSTPEPCGAKVCGPGSLCDGAGKCYPRVPCGGVECVGAACHGTECACTRAVDCAPAPIGAPGDKGTLQDDTFRKGLVDLEFDPDCTAWGVTLISGPDYLRSIAPDGTVTPYAGVTNLNMGEVSVLQRTIVPKARPKGASPFANLEVALSYICCSACGCQLASTPQGVARLDPATSMLPLLIPSQTFTDGKGPFNAAVFDTGPAGLSYGTDRVLYVGNVNTNGDYYRLDLGTAVQTMVTMFPARVHASTPFDAITMLVALEGGEIDLLRVADGTSTPWATSDQPVTGMIRDFFDGAVYIARRDSAIWKYTADGKGALFQAVKNPSRIAIAPDGFLYALEIPPPFADQTPAVERFALPLTR